MTKGEYRVGIKFNPSGSSVVDEIKDKACDLIDLIDAIYGGSGDDLDDKKANIRANEIARLKSLAMDAIEEGAMWAVKAATKQRPE